MASFQSIAEPRGGTGPGGHPTAGSSHGYRKWIVVAVLAGGGAAATAGSLHGYRKWIVVAVLAGGGAAAAILAAGKSGSSPAAAAPAPTVTLTIGTPVITVGKP